MKTKTVLLFLLVFIAGGGVGGFLVGQIQKSRIHHIKERRNPNVFRGHMHKMLETTDEQEQAIDSVMRIYLPRIRKRRLENHEVIRATHDTMLTEIRTYLNPEQIEKLDHFRHKLYKHKKHENHPEHGPGKELKSK